MERKGRIEDVGGLDTRMGVMEEERGVKGNVEDRISTVHGKLNKDREQIKDRQSRARKVSARQGRTG